MIDYQLQRRIVIYSVGEPKPVKTPKNGSQEQPGAGSFLEGAWDESGWKKGPDFNPGSLFRTNHDNWSDIYYIVNRKSL